ncbi:NAD-dependent succinate-semialdehyde dehydrogenase [Spongiibacter sp. KMU-158]|uniref:NAD-dependent succinate-semialdehyde dehydrogenase n=1 Tax=Spongiibacter pelagi TaxID=2760804 RepID=A0A927C586_9GAMM|nr:NAD-dependent succinate-semialdehyde dehydrogenase [Spongiibacter pelagi]MBD2860242.1 NAD-dependent succinate-semialdehyde dehydrogenase [Spongiibacter pelagi]
MLSLNNPDLFRQQAYVNGQWIDAESPTRKAVTNPATGEVLGDIPCLNEAETRAAIEAADTAFASWKKRTAKERCGYLRRWFELIQQNAEDIARIMTAEQGKPLAEARGEVQYAASFIEWFSEEGKRAYGDLIPSPTGDKRLMVMKEPVGVCAAITPWNFPAAMITRKVAPALAAGCTILVRPADATPFTALALAVLAEQAGIPAGVLNILTGKSRVIGAELTANQTVRKLSFTGSTEVGRQLMAQCSSSLKKLSLELGGNAPFIVFEDADIDAAVEGAMMSKFRNTGQTCVCTNRLYVHNAVYEEFSQKLAQAVSDMHVGNGAEEGVNQGPLIDAGAVSKVEEHIADALQHGASLLAGGERHALGGNFFKPTVLGNVTQKMLITREETFGPVAPIVCFSSDEEVIQQANDTEFGLASYFYSRDINRVWRVAEALEYGMVGVNTGIISNEVAPFGGVKQSGFGREGSKYGMDEYQTLKYVCMGGL